MGRTFKHNRAFDDFDYDDSEYGNSSRRQNEMSRRHQRENKRHVQESQFEADDE